MAWVSGQVQKEQNDESSLSDSGFLIKPIDNMFVWIHFGSAYGRNSSKERLFLI